MNRTRAARSTLVAVAAATSLGVGATGAVAATDGAAPRGGSATAQKSDRVQVGGGSTLSTQSRAGWCMSPGAGWYRFTAGELHYKGKTARLRTESLWDKEARGMAWDIAEGDRVTVWRTKKTYKMNKGHRYIKNPGSGTLGCKNTASWYEANIDDQMLTNTVRLQKNSTRSHAVRVCIGAAKGKMKCQSKWYVDGLK